MADSQNAHANLTRGGRLQRTHVSPFFVRTTNPPQVTRTTRIVAATHPGIHQAAHSLDGWFLADFYAFNYLLKGQGVEQTWLTVVPPKNVVAKHGIYVHGSVLQDRKVVLSNELLQENEFTPVTIVRPGNIVDCFLKEVKRATEDAKRDGGSVLILLFCHGIDRNRFALDYTGGTELTITMLRGVLEPYVPVCLTTSACFSGGWTRCPDINITTMTAAAHDSYSFSYPRSPSIERYAGSVFVGSVIKALTGTKPVAHQCQEVGVVKNLIGLGPETVQQINTYNEFCRSIWECCEAINCLWDHHTFTFSAQDDEWSAAWPEMSSLSLTDYQARWNALSSYTAGGLALSRGVLGTRQDGPAHHPTDDPNLAAAASVDSDEDLALGSLLESVSQRRVKESIACWLKTCPGDDVQGYGTMLYGFMRKCYDTGQPTSPELFDIGSPAVHWNAIAIIEYRLNMALIADRLVEDLSLPCPDGKSCLEYDYGIWRASIKDKLGLSHDDLSEETGDVSDVFYKASLLDMMQPAAEQGPIFHRFEMYIVAAVVEAQLSDEERSNVLAKIIDTIGKAAEFRMMTARNDQKVTRRAREWFQSLRQ